MYLSPFISSSLLSPSCLSVCCFLFICLFISTSFSSFFLPCFLSFLPPLSYFAPFSLLASFPYIPIPSLLSFCFVPFFFAFIAFLFICSFLICLSFLSLCIHCFCCLLFQFCLHLNLWSHCAAASYHAVMSCKVSVLVSITYSLTWNSKELINRTRDRISSHHSLKSSSARAPPSCRRNTWSVSFFNKCFCFRPQHVSADVGPLHKKEHNRGERTPT